MPIEMPIDIPMHLTVERRGGLVEIGPARSLPLRSWLGGWLAGAIVALAAHGVMVALSRLNIVTAPLILILVDTSLVFSSASSAFSSTSMPFNEPAGPLRSVRW